MGRLDLPAVAVVGAGHWGRNLVRVLSQLDVLRCVFDADAHRREQLAQEYQGVRVCETLTDVLSDNEIQAVVVATPAATHFELVRDALLTGKHVFVEKPLALSHRHGAQLVDLAAERKKVLMVGHLLRYHPAVVALQQLVRTGALGRIQYIASHRLNLGKFRREENILWSFAPHDLSVILALAGEMPSRVVAQGGYYLHESIADVTTTLLSFSSGLRAHVFVSWLHPVKEQKLVVIGDRQMAVFDDVEREQKLTLYPHAVEWVDQVPVPRKGSGQPVPLKWQEPLVAECEHFLHCVRSGSEPLTNGSEGLRVLEVLEASQRSLQENASVTISRSHGATAPAAPQITVHPSAFVDDGSEIGAGTSIWHFSHVLEGSVIGCDCRIGQNVVVGPRANVGNRVKVQNNVSIYEGVTLEDDVFCGPSMVFTNVYNPRSHIPRMQELRPTIVRRGATLGANSTIMCGIEIGEFAFVGAGAVVLRDVPAYGLVVGNPGRRIGWMCQCGHQLTFNGGLGVCSECGEAYHEDDGAIRRADLAVIA